MLFCGASALPELQATFAGGCLLITAINLPADSGLERHVAAALREEEGGGCKVKWVGRWSGRKTVREADLKKMPSSTRTKPHTGTKKKKKATQITRVEWEGLVISGETLAD